MTVTTETPIVSAGVAASALPRILAEGYGPGAWHGPDLKAALEGVSSETAFFRPAPGRHNIAEVALHHAYCARSVRGRLTGSELEPFVAKGEDWFELTGKSGLSWCEVLDTVEREQARMAAAVADVASGRVTSPLPQAERLDLVLGITCHAVYHAGQVQLLRKLSSL